METKRKKIDIALVDIMAFELCMLEEQLMEAKGTSREPEAKAALTMGIKKMNKILEGSPDDEDDFGIVVNENGSMKVTWKNNL